MYEECIFVSDSVVFFFFLHTNHLRLTVLKHRSERRMEINGGEEDRKNEF